ncbi:putative eisosome assembly associated protein-1 [Elsinoe australis]|uniref:Putative eisosome assembly associated protein-1 n=1 Tax=Elsinoe australis TaxID=40998 RepID=A0A4U7B425_9PEZI|nr:putative eisosome assembly associated protein-1 [Elsinoe australis]
MSTEPTASRNDLLAIMQELFLDSRQPLIIVIDAPDELQTDAQVEILGTLRSAMNQNSTLKVFVSSRYNFPNKNMPQATVYLHMELSEEKDRKIAIYLASKYFSTQEAAIRSKVIAEVASRGNGSAIWIKTVLQYLEGSSIGRVDLLLEALDDIPEDLSRVYGKMYLRAMRDNKTNQRIVRESLELLAVAERPMTLLKLSSFVALGDPKSKLRSLSDLGRKVDCDRVLKLLRFFARTQGQEQSLVDFTHQSLKELVLQRPPNDWLSDAEDDDLDHTTRVTVIHGTVSGYCIKYLLFKRLERSSSCLKAS